MSTGQDAGGTETAVATGNPSHTAAMRILVLSDLAAGGSSAGRPLAATADGFDGLVGAIAPKLELQVPDRLGAGAKELPVSLSLRDLGGFAPDGLAAAVPVLARLVATRALAEERRSGAKDGNAFAAAFSTIWGTDLAGAAPASPAGASALDSLLSKVETTGGAASRRVQPLTELLADLHAAGRKDESSPAIGEIVGEIDRRLSRQVETISAAPPLRELEAAWRGLKFLVDRAGADPRIRIEVLAAPKDDALDLFFERVFREEYDLASETALSLVVADFPLDRSQPDLDLLEHAAKMAESLGVPFVFSSSPAYWGVKQAPLVATLPDLVEKSRGSEYAKWNRFRGAEASLWVAVASNRLLLRDGWAATPAATTFRFVAGEDAASDPPAWGNGGWALAAAIARSFAAGGYAMPLTGPQSPAMLEGLPLRAMKSTKAEPLVSPLEVLYGERRAFELSEAGFAPLVGTAGRDAAWFAAAPTFHQAKRYDQPEATRVSFLTASLQYQLFAGAAAHALQRLGAAIAPGRPAEEIVATIREGMVGFLGALEAAPTAEEIEVDTADVPEEPSLQQVAARLRPKGRLTGGDVDLIVATVVPR